MTKNTDKNWMEIGADLHTIWNKSKDVEDYYEKCAKKYNWTKRQGWHNSHFVELQRTGQVSFAPKDSGPIQRR